MTLVQLSRGGSANELTGGIGGGACMAAWAGLLSAVSHSPHNGWQLPPSQDQRAHALHPCLLFFNCIRDTDCGWLAAGGTIWYGTVPGALANLLGLRGGCRLYEPLQRRHARLEPQRTPQARGCAARRAACARAIFTSLYMHSYESISLGPDPAKSWPQIGQSYASRCIIIFGLTLHRMFLYILSVKPVIPFI